LQKTGKADKTKVKANNKKGEANKEKGDDTPTWSRSAQDRVELAMLAGMVGPHMSCILLLLICLVSSSSSSCGQAW
jgi:hypothetical protein